MADFLFEIGLEEVPARMLAGAQAEMERRVMAMLERERLLTAGSTSESFSTPRRLAVLVHGVSPRQQDLTEEMLGPAAKIAYRDGVPGPAAVAFAKKAGVEVAALRVVDTAKGEYVAATALKPGRAAAEVIAAELPRELAGIYWAKNMYWRAGRPERFVRPVRWLLALLDEDVVSISFAGFQAGRETFGHRVLHGPAPIVIAQPSDYAGKLEAAFVMADVEKRSHTIRKALDRVCRTIPEVRWREDHALVDKMTHLTEWPSVIAGGFESEYLALPQEVLVTVMRDHQNYFAVEAQTEGTPLAPYFLAVLNTATDAAGEEVIRHGNERVLRARFNDARFFWEFDQRVPLNDRVALLEKVTFQKDLGSYAAKSLRVADAARQLAWTARERGAKVHEAALEDAARLAKTDLTTELVKEFTELQGEVGGLYARAQGLSPAAADAIYDQYRPLSMEDRIPRMVEGQLLALADKADTIAGMFGLGFEPTGSKDPFALRRAGNGLVRILAESELQLGLHELVAASGAVGDGAARIRSFLYERLDFYLREAKAQAYDVVKAVLASGSDDVRDAVARSQAVTAARGSDDFAALSAAFKRMKNILAQAEAERLASTTGGIHASAGSYQFTEPDELALVEQATLVSKQVAHASAERRYAESLRAIASLGPQLAAFFDKVMVMDPDPVVRRGRLGLLDLIVKNFSGIADFSQIVGNG